MNNFEIGLATFYGFVVFVVCVIKARDYIYDKGQLHHKWSIARCARQTWFKHHTDIYLTAWAKTPTALDKLEQDLAQTPHGQWYIRVEAGAFKLYLVKKLLISKEEKALEKWYANLTYSDVGVKNPDET